MPRIAKFAVMMLAFAVVVGVALVVGYLRGAEDWAGFTSASDAASTVTKLRKLRLSEVEESIGILENELDAQVLRWAIYDDGLRPIRYLASSARDDDKLLRAVAEYRREHPSRAADPRVRTQVLDSLKKY